MQPIIRVCSRRPGDRTLGSSTGSEPEPADGRAGIIAECDYDSLPEASAADEDGQARISDASESDVLRELMRSSGSTQIQFAKEVGISQSMLSAILNGEREMTKGHMVALARFFNVPPAVFLPS